MDAALANGLASVLSFIINLVELLVIASIVISWIGADPYNPIVQIIRNTTEPLYRPFRGLSDKIPGPLDFAPLILIMILIFIDKSVVSYLTSYARSNMY